MYEYYYNDVPNIGKTRNNLIYTSLMSDDQKTFVQWYYNDGVYHAGQNEVVDPILMEEKFNREVKYLNLMKDHYPNLVPEYTVNVEERKVYLQVDGKDFWNKANCITENYNNVLSDWQDQMLEILKAHKDLGLHKYSMHPSSYFIVDGKLKSMNYFFTYHKSEPSIPIKDVLSHIHSNRQDKMKKYFEILDIDPNVGQPFKKYDILCWESFRSNYPDDFIEKVLKIIKKD